MSSAFWALFKSVVVIVWSDQTEDMPWRRFFQYSVSTLVVAAAYENAKREPKPMNFEWGQTIAKP